MDRTPGDGVPRLRATADQHAYVEGQDGCVGGQHGCVIGRHTGAECQHTQVLDSLFFRVLRSCHPAMPSAISASTSITSRFGTFDVTLLSQVLNEYCRSTLAIPPRFAVPSVTMNNTPRPTNNNPETRFVVCTRNRPNASSLPRSQLRLPSSNRSHSNAIRNSGAAMPNAKIARNSPHEIGSPAVADMVSTLPSNGPAQNPASPYTAPSATTEIPDEMVIRPVARCAAPIPKPRPDNCTMPRQISRMPPARVSVSRCRVSRAPKNPAAAPSGTRVRHSPR